MHYSAVSQEVLIDKLKMLYYWLLSIGKKMKKAS